MQPTYPTVSTDGSTPITYWPAFAELPPAVGQSANKPRPKRKPRPKKSERGGKR